MVQSGKEKEKNTEGQKKLQQESKALVAGRTLWFTLFGPILITGIGHYFSHCALNNVTVVK